MIHLHNRERVHFLLHPSDILFGINAGSKTVYLITGHGNKHIHELEVKGIKPTMISSNFLNTAKKIIEMK